MLLVGTLLVFGVVCAIAAWFVAREAARLSVEPPPPVYDVEEALDWVIANLADDIAATLTPDDARRILDLQVEYLEHAGVTGPSTAVPPDAVVGDEEVVDYVVERAAATGEQYAPVQVRAVLDTQLDYLRAIGAIGDSAAPGRNGGSDPAAS